MENQNKWIEVLIFITFTLKKEICSQVTMNYISIPICSEIKYLGFKLDKKLTWNPHLKNKRKVINAWLHLLRPLLRSKLNINNKLIIYKSLLKSHRHMASDYGEPLNLPIPEQFKPFNPFVFVQFLLHPGTLPTAISTKILKS